MRDAGHPGIGRIMVDLKETSMEGEARRTERDGIHECQLAVAALAQALAVLVASQPPNGPALAATLARAVEAKDYVTLANLGVAMSEAAALSCVVVEGGAKH